MNQFDRCIYDKEIKTPHIICGQCAIARNGLTTQNYIHLDVYTTFRELDKLSLAVLTFHYKEKIDKEHYLRPMITNPNLLLPIPERAIVEYILDEELCDEGTLIEALKTYLGIPHRCSLELLYEVADFFGLQKDTLDDWILEAETDEEV